MCQYLRIVRIRRELDANLLNEPIAGRGHPPHLADPVSNAMDRWFGGGGVRTRQNGNYIFLAEAGLEPLREVAPDEVRIGITI